MKEKGEQSLHEAKNMRDQLESRSKAVEQRMMELKEEEKKVAIVSESVDCLNPQANPRLAHTIIYSLC